MSKNTNGLGIDRRLTEIRLNYLYKELNKIKKGEKIMTDKKTGAKSQGNEIMLQRDTMVEREGKLIAETASIYEILSKIDVSQHIEKLPDGLTYLSWAWAWDYLKQKFPTATYEVLHFEGAPYVYNAKLGYMVFTNVTINDFTLSCHLPVLDAKNKAMRNEPYTYKTKYEVKTVQAATMFDVNTAIMRCLAKNIALHGLGMSLYTGEDLIDTTQPMTKNNTAQQPRPQIDNIDNMETSVNDYVSKRQAEAAEIKTPDGDKICPLCGSLLVKRTGARGTFLGCSTYPQCKHTEQC